MPEPPHATTVSDIQKNIVDACNKIEGTRNEDEICEIAVSCDGKWQERGYNSLNGVVTVISIDTGKCVDYRRHMENCKTYQLWEG